MMKKFLRSITLLLLLLPQLANGQERYINEIQVKDVEVSQKSGSVTVLMNIILDDLKIRSNDVIYLSPALRKSGSDEILKVLPPVQVAGRKRAIVLDRMKSTGLAAGQNLSPLTELTHRNGKGESIPYSYTMPRESWMEHADLIFVETVHGCADCFVRDDIKVLLTPFISEPYKPKYLLTYITPEVEPVKARADKHSASFNFVVDRHELRRDYKNNANELARVDKVMKEVLSNKDIKVTEFAIIGYASPEGSFEYNRQLAERRAYAFAEYLASEHGVKKNQVKVTGHGEDWEGLTKALESSTLPKKAQLLEIIKKTGNPDARDSKIKSLDNGDTYSTLIKNYYPALRRTDYLIAYHVRAFNVEEAKEIIKTNPKLLSLNEMYLVAKTYDSLSKEFKEVFDIATRLYPDEPVAIINASAVDIEGGNYQAAIDRLSKISNNAEAVNNIGVAYARMGNMEQAKASFQRAAGMGSDNAKHNLEELTKQQESL
ncbi:DUF3868 domain-containing protein [Porphyromonadaceae bacterium W3.11]|nr:DUF3868 domain-containing protein [Porphyromonadaceae bacterium W3.11]